MLPIRIGPIVWAVLAIVGISFAWWLAEALRESGRAEVHAEYAAAARKLNVEVDAFTDADEAMASLADAALKSALAKSKQVAGSCGFTPEQAAAINAIRRVK